MSGAASGLLRITHSSIACASAVVTIVSTISSRLDRGGRASLKRLHVPGIIDHTLDDRQIGDAISVSLTRRPSDRRFSHRHWAGGASTESYPPKASGSCGRRTRYPLRRGSASGASADEGERDGESGATRSGAEGAQPPEHSHRDGSRAGPAKPGWLVAERCEWPDSNRHGVTHWHLRPARLPIPPHSQAQAFAWGATCATAASGSQAPGRE